MTTALCDGDLIAFRASAACQQEIDWQDGGEPSVYADIGRAAKSACDTARAWADLAGCSDIVVAFTDRLNWRKAILRSYKENRVGKAKPQAYLHTVNAMAAAFQTRVVSGLEADDLLAIMATNGRYPDSVILSLDKDFMTVPTRVMNPLKQRAPVEVTPAMADHFWMTQTLIGDTTDNYAGLPGIGPKKAAVLLGQPYGDADYLWPSVAKAYASRGLSEADAVVQARVSRILRAEDWNRDTQSVRLWGPRDTHEWKTLAELIAEPEKPAEKQKRATRHEQTV